MLTNLCSKESADHPLAYPRSRIFLLFVVSILLQNKDKCYCCMLVVQCIALGAEKLQIGLHCDSTGIARGVHRYVPEKRRWF